MPEPAAFFCLQTKPANAEYPMPVSKQQQYGWKVVAASWLAVFSLFGIRASFAMLKDPISLQMGWSQSAVTLGYSVMMVWYAITAYFSGVLLDRKGPRPVYLTAALLGSVGLFAAAASHLYLLYLLFFGLLTGISTGMLWVTSTVSIRKWYVGSSYAGMWGIAFMGAPAAQFLMALLMGRILKEGDPGSWRSGMMVLGSLVLLTLLAATALSKREPEAYGFAAFGEKSSRESGKAPSIWSLRKAFATFPVWGIMAAFLANMIGEFLVWTQVISYWSVDLAWPRARALGVYGLIGMTGILSMPLMGRLADRVVLRCGNEARGRKLMLAAGSLLGCAAVGLLLLSRYGTVYGVAAALLFACYWAVVPGGVVGYTGAIYGRQTLGRIWGLATLIVMGIGPFTGSFLGSLFRDLSGTYTPSLLFALSAFLLALVPTFALPESLQESESD
jgi:MFS transporter, OFA family, oxalate/formate antiporter